MIYSRYSRRPLRLSLITVLLAAVLGVFSKRTAQTQVTTLPLDFPHVVIFATNSARLQSNAHVVAGHVVVNNASAGLTVNETGVELGLSTGALTPAGSSLVADSIRISSNAIVNGNVFYNSLNNQGTINGAQSSPLPPFPIFTPLPEFKSALPGSRDITVAKNQVHTLPPGNYGDIKVETGATLKLASGIFNVRSISMDASAKLWFQNLSSASNKTEVRVLNQVTTASDCFIGPDDANPTKAAQIIFYVAYPTPADRLILAAVGIGNGNTILANFYAPNGTLVLHDKSLATGAFLAKDVVVSNGVRIDLEPFFNNQSPVIAEGDSTTVTMSENSSPTAFSLTLNATDPEADTLTWSISSPASHGTASASGTGNSQAIDYTPTADYNGMDSFVVQVADGHGGSDAITVHVTITEVNDPPMANNDSATVAEDSGATPIAVLANDSRGPANESGQTLTITAVTQGAHGTVDITGGGTGLTYTPAADYNGPDSFTYTVCDNGTTNGVLDSKCSAPATVTVTVTEVNAPPVAGADSATVAEDSGATAIDVLANDTSGPANESGQALTITAVSQGRMGR